MTPGYIGPTEPTLVVTPPRAGPRTFCVLGLPRGGTSMIALLLHRMGVFMGADLDPLTNEDRVFTAHRGRRDLFTVDARRAEKEVYLEAIGAMIGDRNHAHQVWGWKDPISSFYISEIAPQLRNPHYLFVTRDPGLVGQREMLIEASSYPASHVYAHIHGAAASMMSICGFLAGQDAPQLLIVYERAIRDPAAFVGEVAAFVGLPAPEDLGDLIRAD
jgi:hypothetical protein